MELLGPVIAVLELLAYLGPMLAYPRPAATSRNERRVPQTDDWKCPNSAEFARILRSQDREVRQDGAGDVFSSLPANGRHALWDRELDG